MAAPRTSWESWIDTEKKRFKAMGVLQNAALPFSVHFKRNSRTSAQNNKIWPMIRPIQKALTYNGHKLSEEDWKCVFVASLSKELLVVPTINNDGIVTLGQSSRELTVDEFSNLIDLVEEYASRHDIDVSRQAQNARKELNEPQLNKDAA